MKILNTSKSGSSYEFKLLERSNVVEISKNNTFTYLIDLNQGFFACNCPGRRYHNKCWHTKLLNILFLSHSIQEPWAEWCEEAGRMQYG